ncbi:MAG: hydroxylamine reductase [Candidatus Omnitrophica bacterium]|nr:hydroxylamine reductase [Candidatus Omnitrophota bacterium]
MFCYQCEQAFRGKGCEDQGVCGKTPEVAALLDVLLHQTKGIGYFAHQARLQGVSDQDVNRFTLEALFVTVTNVNFDPESIQRWIYQAQQVKEKAKALLGKVSDENVSSAAFQPAADLETLTGQGFALKIIGDDADPDLRSLKHLLIYGLKGLAAYAHHAAVLGYEDEKIYALLHEGLHALNRKDIPADELLGLNLKCGEVNLRCMEILDQAHHETYGHPEPTEVSKTIRKGPAIIVSGHDLLDLENILKQTEGKGISVYTHGEMLPAHGYPKLKAYQHLAGHFGTAWQNQANEFDGVPAAIYFTTNCIQEPKDSYRDRTFTGGTVGWPGLQHVENQDYSAVIEKALQLGGFKEETAGGKLMTGFGHHAVLSVAGQVVEGVKSGAIRHFFLVGGCDGAKPGRNYYTEFAQSAPQDSIVMTLGCGKFRFNDKDFGTIGGLPRLLDIGQCNDAYSAIKIAGALAGAFGCGVNDLPLSLIISWYEQKAVVVLLSLLALGIKGIRLGPSLPAFITPNILKVLVEKFDLKPIKTAQEDLQEILRA